MTLIANIGAAGASRFGATKSRMAGGLTQGIGYPSPFFDVAHTWLPATVKQLFRWCRYYFMTNPLVNATVFKLSEYPVTDIIIDHENPKVVKDWTEYFQDHLRYRAFQVEVGLDYHCYGNALISLGFPFKKYLTCTHCGFVEQAEQIKQYWVFTSYEFRLTCPKCGNLGPSLVKDQYYKSASSIRPIRWNPEDVEIEYNDLTGHYTHYYTIPNTIRNDVIMGKKDKIIEIPQVFIQAMKEQKGVVFSKDNIFHMRRPTIASQDRGWGTPLLLPVLKDAFYLQVMKKAQEAILLEHIVPLRVIFPQTGSGAADPYTTINLVDWRDHVAQEIARWRYDNNYIPILPLPIGNQTIGGDGRALLLTGEIQQWSEQIMVGMGVPREFLMGGMSYAGTNVSMRMLENAFVGYLIRHKQLARFIMKTVAAAMEWPEVNIRFKPFKMADDIQRKSLLFQYNQANKISDTTMLADSDLSQEEENEIMMRETDQRTQAMEKQQLAMADVQGKAQMIMMKYQAKAQQAQQQAMAAPVAPGEPGGPDGAQQGQPVPQEAQSPLNASQQMGQDPNNPTMNVDLMGMAQAQAKLIMSMPPALQQMAIQNLQTQQPELAQLVQQLMAQMGGGQAQSGVDMRPLPEQRGPRRDTAAV